MAACRAHELRGRRPSIIGSTLICVFRDAPVPAQEYIVLDDPGWQGRGLTRKLLCKTSSSQYLFGHKPPWMVNRVNLDVNGRRIDVWAWYPLDLAWGCLCCAKVS